MGFHDDVHCAHDLARQLGVSGGTFQTKMLGRGSGEYTITPEGRLIRHLFEHRWLAKRDPMDVPWVESTRTGSVDTEFHGDLVLSGYSACGVLTDFVARFTHGALESITPLTELSGARREMLDTLQDGC